MYMIFKLILLQSIMFYALNANIQNRYSKTGEKEFIAPVIDNSKHEGGILDAAFYGNNMLYTLYVNRTNSKLMIQKGDTPLDWLSSETEELLKGLSLQQRREV